MDCERLMHTFGVLVAVLFGFALVIWIWRRFQGLSKHRRADDYAVVAPDEARLDPYPYVYVDRDGGARELHPDERSYLESYFSPFDGARPYIKSRYPGLNGWGEISGYLKRSKLPNGLQVSSAPSDNPNKPLGREGMAQFLRDTGLDVVEQSDGAYTARKRTSTGPLGLS